MTMRSTADERLRRAFSGSEGPLSAGDGCPPDEQIWAASRGELPSEQTQALLEHSQQCESCAESWRMAAAIGEAAGEAAGEDRGQQGSRTWLYLAGAVAANGQDAQNCQQLLVVEMAKQGDAAKSLHLLRWSM